MERPRWDITVVRGSLEADKDFQRLANTRLLPKIWKIPEDERKMFMDRSLPIDVSHLSLFDTAYVHPIVRDSMVVWDNYDAVAVGSGWISTGSTLGFDQFVGGVPPEKLHASRRTSLALCS